MKSKPWGSNRLHCKWRKSMMRILSDWSLKNWRSSDRVLMQLQKKTTSLRGSAKALRIRTTTTAKNKTTCLVAKWTTTQMETTVISVSFKQNTSIRKFTTCLKLKGWLQGRTCTLVLRRWGAGRQRKVSYEHWIFSRGTDARAGSEPCRWCEWRGVLAYFKVHLVKS